MKTLTLVVLVALATSGAAQVARGDRQSKNQNPKSRVPSPPTPLPRGEEGRLDAIVGFATDRLSTQIDVLFEDGDFPASINLLKLQAEAFPADYDVWTNLGWMQENVEQWDAALATYVRYKRQNPKDPDNTLPEATFYYNRKLFAKVPPLLEPSLRQKVHPNAYRILAKSYERQNMLGDALRVYKALVARDNDETAKMNVRRIEGKMAKER